MCSGVAEEVWHCDMQKPALITVYCSLKMAAQDVEILITFGFYTIFCGSAADKIMLLKEVSKSVISYT